MSPNTDAYWVGAFAMAIVVALRDLKQGDLGIAVAMLEKVMANFAESPVLDEQLKAELAPYWAPRKEPEHDSTVV